MNKNNDEKSHIAQSFRERGYLRRKLRAWDGTYLTPYSSTLGVLEWAPPPKNKTKHTEILHSSPQIHLLISQLLHSLYEQRVSIS